MTTPPLTRSFAIYFSTPNSALGIAENGDIYVANKGGDPSALQKTEDGDAVMAAFRTWAAACIDRAPCFELPMRIVDTRETVPEGGTRTEVFRVTSFGEFFWRGRPIGVDLDVAQAISGTLAKAWRQ